MPPKPDPDAVQPFASDRFVLNHCAATGADATNISPIPSPNDTPWLRMRCHSLLAKDEPMKPILCPRVSKLRCSPFRFLLVCVIRQASCTYTSSITPVKMVSRVPYRFEPARKVARGEIKRAITP